jgi:hypothetical protein
VVRIGQRSVSWAVVGWWPWQMTLSGSLIQVNGVQGSFQASMKRSIAAMSPRRLSPPPSTSMNSAVRPVDKGHLVRGVLPSPRRLVHECSDAEETVGAISAAGPTNQLAV